MSRDYEHHEPEKKSSGIAKAGLTLGVIGTSLAALGNGGALGNGDGNGGILGNLFGNRESGEVKAYRMAQFDQGQKASTELDMLNKYVIPMASEISNLKTLAAVNAEKDAKNEVITGLMFQLAEQKSQCCCDKTNLRIDAIYDKLSAQDQYTYERLAADTNCNFNRLNDKIDANFNLRDAIVNGQFAAADAKLEKAMCGVIKGQPYLSPSNLADPYTAGRNMIVSRNVTPVMATYGGCGSTFNTGCGCNEWAW